MRGKVADLQTSQASSSALLAQTSQLANQAIVNAGSLGEQVASTSASISSLSQQIDDFISGFTSGFSSSSSANLNLTSPDTLISSQSATVVNLEVLSTATVSGELKAFSSTVQDTFKSFGMSYLNDTNVSGNFNVGSTLAISQNSINVTGTLTPPDSHPTDGILYLQNSPLANLIDIFNGAVVIYPNGNIQTKGDIAVGGNLNVLGEAQMMAGANITGDLNLDGAITITASAGAQLTAGDALYIASDGAALKADTTDLDKSDVVGIAANDAQTSEQVKLIISGKAKLFNKLQTGRKYYLGTDGAITTDIPSNAVQTIPLVIAVSGTELIIRIAPAGDAVTTTQIAPTPTQTPTPTPDLPTPTPTVEITPTPTTGQPTPTPLP